MTRELRIALRVESCGSGDERNFSIGAGVAHQSASHRGDRARRSAEHSPVDVKALDLEQSGTGREVHTSEAFPNAPGKGPAMDVLAHGIVNSLSGDHADHGLPAYEVGIALSERCRNTQHQKQRYKHFHWILILFVSLIFETRPGPIGPVAAARVWKLQQVRRGSFSGVSV